MRQHATLEMRDARTTAEIVYKEEAGRIIASLIRLSGSFDLAEEALQEALTAALQTWPERGIPANPAAWITSAAQRKLIDMIRRENTKRHKAAALAQHIEVLACPEAMPDESDMLYPDDRLRLIFTCCHPALSVDAQVALTLRTLGGLSTMKLPGHFLRRSRHSRRGSFERSERFRMRAYPMKCRPRNVFPSVCLPSRP